MPARLDERDNGIVRCPHVVLQSGSAADSLRKFRYLSSPCPFQPASDCVYFPTVSASNVKGYKAAFLLCEPIANKKMVDIKLDDLQYIADSSGKNEPTLKKFKILMNAIFKYAVIHDIIPPDMNKVSYLNIKKAGNPDRRDRMPFSTAEIQKLWKHKDANGYNSCGACTEKRPLLSYLLMPGFLKVVSEHNYFIALQKHKESNGGQLIDKYFKERYRRMKEQDEADRKKAEERKAKRAAARAKKQQLTA